MDKIYSRHGVFIVHANNQPGRPTVCFAATQTRTNNGRPLDVNFAFDGRLWIISFPYPKGTIVRGGLELDGMADSFRAEPLGDGYSAFTVAGGFINDLRRGSVFRLQIPGVGRAAIRLKGSGKALGDVRTCVKRAGVRPAAQSRPSKASPAAPQAGKQAGKQKKRQRTTGGPSEWGGYQIAGTGQAREKRYEGVRGWRVRSARHKGKHAYCVGVYRKDGYNVRLGWDGQQWQLAVPVKAKPNWSGTLEVDGDARGMSGSAVGKWTIAWLALWDLERVAQGSQGVLSMGRADYDFPLSGSAAAIKKIEECHKRRGKPKKSAGNAGKQGNKAGKQGNKAGKAPQKAKAGKGCGPGDVRLPKTGLCQSKALSFLPVRKPVDAVSIGNCPFKVNETAFAGGQVLLYLSEHCPNKPPRRLVYGGGARNAVVYLKGGPAAEPGPYQEGAITVIGLDPGDPVSSLQQSSRNAMRADGYQQSKIGLCFIQQRPAGHYVFEPTAAHINSLPGEGPGEWSCGPAGPGDALAYWRVFGGHGWLFQHGQDMITGYEPMSLTLITPNGSGGWKLAK